jgi:hypothetical protein
LANGPELRTSSIIAPKNVHDRVSAHVTVRSREHRGAGANVLQAVQIFRVILRGRMTLDVNSTLGARANIHDIAGPDADGPPDRLWQSHLTFDGHPRRHCFSSGNTRAEK